jgi:hypothetical protein
MSNKLWSLASVAAMAMVPAMVGCAAETTTPPVPSTDKVADGLTVLSTTDDTHLNLAFRKEGITIFLQANRGHIAPEPYQVKDAPTVYEVDARFVADNGRTFFLQRGGDEWVDPTWGEEFARDQATPMASISNEKLFAMAQEASELLDVKLPVQLGAEKLTLHTQTLGAIRSYGKVAVAEFAANKVLLAAHRAQLGEAVKEIPYGSGGPDVGNIYLGQNYYYIALHRKSIYLLGEHSATETWSWNGSAWATPVYMCNHGECSYGMGRKCLLQYYERLNGTYNGFDLQTCKTGYDAFSGGGGHNCHDDSRLQLSNFHHNNSNDGYSQWCNGGGGGIGAPGCYDYNY